MRKRFLATLLALAMVLSVTPFALASSEDGAGDGAEAGTISQPTAGGNVFFANGTPITISAEAPADATQVTFSNLNTDGEVTTYISWTNADGQLVYLAATQGLQFVFGGGNGAENPVSIASTSITMTGGKIRYLYGGNYGYDGKTEGKSSTVVGDVRISLSGSAVVGDVLYGGGKQNTSVQGTVYMEFNDIDLSSEKTNSCYVNGGVHGNGNEGTRNIEAGTMTTDAVANKVVIKAVDSEFYLIGGGGGGSTKVKDADVTLTDCEVNYLYLSGINGEVVDSSIVATGCTIGSFSATNRGFVGTGSVDLNDCTVTKLNTGAANGCFTSDSGGTDGSGVTGSCVWDLDAGTRVTEAQLTPLVIKDNGSYTNTYENLTVKKAGEPLELKVTSFVANEKDDNTKQQSFTVPEGSTLTLNNVETTIADGNTLTNAGTIDMDDASKLTVESNATLGQAGTVNGDVVVDEGGTITKYVARVGNKGYKTLAEAINAATDGQTIVLLQNIDELSELTTGTTSGSDISLLSITESVTINGNGYGITITMPNDATKRSQAISVGSETVQDITVTLDDVDLTINGKNAAADKGDAIDMWATLNITNGSTVTMNGIANGFVMQGGMNAKVNVSGGSSVKADGVSGHFSNGGVWSITDSTVNIANCGTHGLSVETVKIDNSTVTVDGAKYTGLYGTTIEIVNGANVTVQNCGTSLAGTTYADKGVVQLKAVSGNEGTLTVTDSTLTLTGNSNGAEDGEQTIYIGKGDMKTKNAQINGTLKLDESVSGSKFTVAYVNDGKQITTMVVNKDSTITLMEALPNQGYNHFVGWNDGSKTHDAGAQVTISKDTTFTAVWTYIPPANPSYLISVSQAEGGKVTANPTAAKKGDTVTLTITPEDGYELAELTVTDFWGKDVALTANGDGTYTFTMPGSQVEVKASFTQAEKPELPFTDVTEADWFYDEVQYVVDNGLMIGTSDTTFDPNGTTTRAMVWTILARMDGETITGSTWVEDARAWAMANGVSDGTGADDAVTREQLVTMLWRYVGEPAGTGDLSGFADADTVSGWAEEAMSWSVGTGLIVGDENGLTPTATAIRAQIAAILMRFCENVAK